MTYDDDRTELASALLDGTLPDEAAAAARRDPAVMTRLAQLEQARDRVRDVPPPPIEARDAMLAAALDAYDTAQAEPPVSELEALRRARGERRQAPPRWLGAAAAVALVLAGVGVVAVLAQQSADQDDQASVTAADEATQAGGSGEDSSASDDAETGAAAPEAQDAPTTAASRTAPAQLGELGSFANSTDLVARVRDDALLDQAQSEEGADTALSGPGAATTLAGCASGTLPGVLQDQDNAVVALGSATVDGKAVSVWVADTPSGRRVVLVDSDFRTVANRSLE
jgi:hypothetical protein